MQEEVMSRIEASDVPGTFESDLVTLIGLYKAIKIKHERAMNVLNYYRNAIFNRGVVSSFEVLGIIDDTLEVLVEDDD